MARHDYSEQELQPQLSSEAQENRDIIAFLTRTAIDTSAQVTVLRSLLEKSGVKIADEAYEDLCKAERREVVKRLARQPSRLGKMATEIMAELN